MLDASLRAIRNPDRWRVRGPLPQRRVVSRGRPHDGAGAAPELPSRSGTSVVVRRVPQREGDRQQAADDAEQAQHVAPVLIERDATRLARPSARARSPNADAAAAEAIGPTRQVGAFAVVPCSS
jgi:hypothetical protein